MIPQITSQSFMPNKYGRNKIKKVLTEGFFFMYFCFQFIACSSNSKNNVLF